jgi:putative DNA primase/helicase
MPNDIVTEDSAAQQFVELHGDKFRYCHSHGAVPLEWLLAGRSTPALLHSARELAQRRRTG